MSDLNHVAVFAQVVAAGSFSEAARALGIPKSSASRSVKQLEDALSVRLLERTTRRLRLTEAGREYHARVAAALAGLDEARAAVTEMQETPKGVVRLAAPAAWSSWLLSPVIAEFVERHPEIHIDLALVERDVDLLRDGFDLALKMGKLDDSSVIVRTIGTIDCGLFASESYLARRGTPRRLADLANHDVIVGGADGSGRRLRLKGPNGLESVAVHGRVSTNSLTFTFESVRLGMGIGLLPAGGCTTHLQLAPVLPEYAEPGLTCSLVYPSSRYLPQRVALLRDALISGLQSRMHHRTTSCGKELVEAALKEVTSPRTASAAVASATRLVSTHSRRKATIGSVRAARRAGT